ncbi:DUF2955 domain-containing protein [Inquilinus sp.]|uniref:DUF2955 domain-containing protein n=1 Tax=Inquilinus sp. TaxID=1932117 RepID=UPI0037851EA7
MIPVQPALRVKRQGLRVAAAVAVGFTVAVANGEILPFLAPMFAAQFLIASPRPLGAKPAIGMIAVILVAGEALVWLTGLFGDRPAVLLILLGLIYFACFLLQAQGKGGAAAFLIIVIAVMVPILGILQKDLGESIVLILFKGVLGGVVLTWLAHAVIPDPGGDDPASVVAAGVDRAVRRALANTAILLAMVVLCLVDSRFSTALVVPITVASLLNQLDLAVSGRAALGLMIVNLFGGIVASLAFAFVEVHPTLLFLCLTVLVVGLLFGGRAAADPKAGKVYAGALTTFLILFGLGVSPLPASTPDSFTTRIGFVLFAIVCTFCLTALLWPAPSAQRERPRR